MSTEEHRQSIRYSHHCSVVVAHGKISYLTQLDNLSEQGCCVKKDLEWNFSGNDVLRIFLIIDNETVIDAEAMIAWEDADHVGLKYLEPHKVPIRIIENEK
jgi:PilZ domain